MSNRIEDLSARAQPIMRMYDQNLTAAGIRHVFTSTLRTAIEQFCIWLQSRVTDHDALLDEVYAELCAARVDMATAHAVVETVRLRHREPPAVAVINVARQHAKLPPVGKSDAANWATDCDGVNTPSNHQSGNAADVNPLRADGSVVWYPGTASEVETFRKMGAIARSCGLKTGQDWPPMNPANGLGRDPDHVEL